MGAYTRNYYPLSLNFKSDKNEELIFELTMFRPAEINLRIVQMYSEYFGDNVKNYYEYSPILMELYDHKMTLVSDCEGILENFSGNRSSHISERMFILLSKGKYYLRVQVNWFNQVMVNSANIVIYALKDTC